MNTGLVLLLRKFTYLETNNYHRYSYKVAVLKESKKVLNKKLYANGQKTHELIGQKLTYFFKNGNVKAEGTYENELMKGEWKFYRETGQLWQVGTFENGKKNGSWIRYDRNNQLEYKEEFVNDKKVKDQSRR